MSAARKAIVLGLALLAGVFADRVAGAQNVVKNGRFTGSITPFKALNAESAAPGVLAYNPGLDFNGPFGSGSMMLVNSLQAPNTSVGASFCIPGVAPGTTYYASAHLAFASGEVAEGIAGVLFAPLASPDCSLSAGPALDGFPLVLSTDTDPRGIWLEKKLGSITSSPMVMPAGTKSMIVLFLVGRTSVGGNLTGRLDNLFLSQVGKPKCHGKTPTIGGREIDDFIIGTPGPDVIVTFSGDDTIDGLGGDDTICAGRDDDTVIAGDGDDFVNAGSGRDDVDGGPGDDILKGASGNDALDGGEGVDKLSGGLGSDACDGGPDSPDTAVGCSSVKGTP